jgi:glucan-binding YG repeat protein
MGSPFEDAEVEIKDQTYTGSALTPEPTVRLDDRVLRKGFHYDVEYENNVNPGTATVAISGLKGYAGGTIKKTFRIIGHDKDGWIDLAGGHKGYVKRGKLVKGWLSIGSSKYWFGDDGVMATGWTDVEASGKTMRYYFNPTSGNLARGTWMTIDGKKYYFRPSGNMATGFADIDDSGTTKKYYFDSEGQMLTGWQEIEVNGKLMRYYFRPAGSMATGWATIDGEKYYFRTSGNMATGFTTVTDGSKRYFHEDGTMHVGWLELSGRTYYFRPSGAMQTGTAKIGDFTYEFNGSGVLVREVLSAQAEEQIEVELGHDEEPSGLVALSDDQVDAAEEVGNALEATDDVDTTEKAATPDIVEVTD